MTVAYDPRLYNPPAVDANGIPAGWVYFIASGPLEHKQTAIKIGYAKDPRIRLVQLQGSHWLDLKLVACIPGTRGDEGLLQRKFSYLRIRGEWFRADDDLRRFIANLDNDVPT